MLEICDKDVTKKVSFHFILLVGKAATNAVSRCRTAIQDENPRALLAAMRNG